MDNISCLYHQGHMTHTIYICIQIRQIIQDRTISDSRSTLKVKMQGQKFSTSPFLQYLPFDASEGDYVLKHCRKWSICSQ